MSFFCGRLVDGADSRLTRRVAFPLFFTLPRKRHLRAGRKLTNTGSCTCLQLSTSHLYPTRPRLLLSFLEKYTMPRFMNETGATTAGAEAGEMFIMTTRWIPQIY